MTRAEMAHELQLVKQYSAGTADPALAMTYKLAVVMLALLNEPEAEAS